jgi:hypothetical protein
MSQSTGERRHAAAVHGVGSDEDAAAGSAGSERASHFGGVFGEAGRDMRDSNKPGDQLGGAMDLGPRDAALEHAKLTGAPGQQTRQDRAGAGLVMSGAKGGWEPPARGSQQEPAVSHTARRDAGRDPATFAEDERIQRIQHSRRKDKGAEE